MVFTSGRTEQFRQERLQGIRVLRQRFRRRQRRDIRFALPHRNVEHGCRDDTSKRHVIRRLGAFLRGDSPAGGENGGLLRCRLLQEACQTLQLREFFPARPQVLVFGSLVPGAGAILTKGAPAHLTKAEHSLGLQSAEQSIRFAIDSRGEEKGI